MRRVKALPTGTLTMLFTDIEGSTKLRRRLGNRYVAVLTEHRPTGDAADDSTAWARPHAGRPEPGQKNGPGGATEASR